MSVTAEPQSSQLVSYFKTRCSQVDGATDFKSSKRRANDGSSIVCLASAFDAATNGQLRGVALTEEAAGGALGI